MHSRLRRFWEPLRELPDHVSLRIKLVSALLALVAIALTVISVSSLAVFRGYLLNRAETQIQVLLIQASHQSQTGGPYGPPFSLPGYVVELRDSHGNVLSGFGSWQDLTGPGPDVPHDSG